MACENCGECCKKVFHLNSKCMIGWAMFLVMYEVVTLIRKFGMGEADKDLIKLLPGDKPDPTQAQSYFIAVALLAIIRLLLVCRPFDAALAQMNAIVHTIEVPVITYLIYQKNWSNIASINCLMCPKFLCNLALIGIITYNAIVFVNYYRDLESGEIKPSVSRARSESSARAPSVDESPKAKKKSTSRAASKKKKN